ncbi:MAG TPA: carboxypeptidase-like regulatory domain-containing protein, partial [Balneolales bacterium]|nr:carboxypeptidase-like regulatory domain-containing protein [Balneolales bacterium]
MRGFPDFSTKSRIYKMRHAFIILILSLIGFEPVLGQKFTQTVRGIVMDAETHATLPGAHVIIQPSDPVLGAITDKGGAFTIRNVPLGRYQVNASFLGYQTNVAPGVLVGSGKEVYLVIELREIVY